MTTVRVRIPVLVDPRGNWNGFGWGDNDGIGNVDVGCIYDGMPDDTTEAECRLYYIEADVPVPAVESVTIEGEVKRET